MCQAQDAHHPAWADTSGRGSLKIAFSFFYRFREEEVKWKRFFFSFSFLSEETLKPGLASHLKGEILYCTSKQP